LLDLPIDFREPMLFTSKRGQTLGQLQKPDRGLILPN